jgi:hypothetical protein
MQRKVRLAQYSEYSRAQLGGDKSRTDLRHGLDDHRRLVSKLDPLPMHGRSLRAWANCSRAQFSPSLPESD